MSRLRICDDAFDLECARCKKFGAPTKPPAQKPSPIAEKDFHCSNCGLLNNPRAVDCRQCNAPMSVATPLIPAAGYNTASGDDTALAAPTWRLGTVLFKATTPEGIEAQARHSIRGETRDRSGGFSLLPIWIFFWTPFVGTFLLFVGLVWTFIGIGLWCVFLWALYEGIGKPLFGRVGALADKRLAGEKYLWRDMRSGPYPICGGQILITANEDCCELTCRLCRGPLLFENGYVSPR